MNGIKGLFDSKKAFFTLLFFVACCAGWLTGKMPTDQWAQFSLIALGGYFAAETTNAVLAPKKAGPKTTHEMEMEVQVTTDTANAEKALERLQAKAKGAADAIEAASAAAAAADPEVLT